MVRCFVRASHVERRFIVGVSVLRGLPTVQRAAHRDADGFRVWCASGVVRDA